MKYVLGIILAFALILPSKSLAGENNIQDTSIKNTFNLMPELWGFAIGAGPQIFSAGIDIFWEDFGVIYPRTKIGPADKHLLLWTNRFRLIYEFENQQYGLLFQPNIRWVWKNDFLYLFTVTLGPEIGWEAKTGFEYGISLRTGGIPSLIVANYEVGYLVNSKKIYFTVSFAFSTLPIKLALPSGFHG